MPKIRVLIVDDSVVFRRVLTDCLAGDPGIEVVGTAADGKIALNKIELLQPDLVTLDIEMPVLDGLQTVKALRKVHPRLPVIMFSSLTERGATDTLDALAFGANDYVTKPVSASGMGDAMQRVRDELIPKIKSLCRRTVAAEKPAPLVTRKPFEPKPSSPGNIDVVAIGVSTGGPNALAALIPQLSKNFPVPIVIVQHMPPMFTRLLAERLGTLSGFPTREGEPGALLRPGEIWIAPGGLHMEMERKPAGVHLKTHDGPFENSCRPAVDVLFRSVVKVFGGRTLGVILTGMGQDGLRGCQSIREAGGQVLAQDEASSVVWGMPGAVAAAGLAEKVLPLSELAGEINRRVQRFSASISVGGTALP